MAQAIAGLVPPRDHRFDMAEEVGEVQVSEVLGIEVWAAEVATEEVEEGQSVQE